MSLAGFLAVTVGGGLLIGALTAPGPWYAGLAKPDFNPPGWVFGPVWTLLYLLTGIAGWRLWDRGAGGTAKGLWIAQLLLNFSWSPVFFRVHAIGAALAIVAALLAVILAFIARTWRSDPVAAMLFVPYGAWVAFASVLNAAIWVLN